MPVLYNTVRKSSVRTVALSKLKVICEEVNSRGDRKKKS